MRERERERERGEQLGRGAMSRGQNVAQRWEPRVHSTRPCCALAKQRRTAGGCGRYVATPPFPGLNPERESLSKERERERDREEREREERESLFVCMYLCTCVCVYIYLLRIHIRYQGNAPIWKAVEFCSVLILTKPY